MPRKPGQSPFTIKLLLLMLAVAALGAWNVWGTSWNSARHANASDDVSKVAEYDNSKTHVAIFAGGCFWCVESDFDHVPGVLETTSGYIGGTTANPTYKSVTYGNSGHREAVKIIFDPEKVTYAKLLDVFWRSVDPTDDGGQFCDRGESYETEIFATSDVQLKVAQTSKKALVDSGRLKAPIVTPIRRAGYLPTPKATIRTIIRRTRYSISTTDIAAGETPEFALSGVTRLMRESRKRSDP